MWGISDASPEGMSVPSFSYPAFEQLRRDNRVLEDLFAFKDAGKINASIDGNAQILQGELAAAASLLALIGLAATWVPARRRAAAVEPMEALRHEYQGFVPAEATSKMSWCCFQLL